MFSTSGKLVNVYMPVMTFKGWLGAHAGQFELLVWGRIGISGLASNAKAEWYE
jgi:O-antigen ligase